MNWENPVTWIIVPGFLGGLVIALAIFLLGRRGSPSQAPFTREPLSTDVINYSRVRVAGVGGLGLVAMAIVIAWNVPRIGQSLSIGLILGVMCAALAIVWRSRKGPLPSSGARGGANTTLGIDGTSRAEPTRK